MKAFVISFLLLLLGGITSLHFTMSSANMGMQQTSSCLGTCLAAGHNFSVGTPSARILELFSFFAIAALGLLFVTTFIARKHFSLLNNRPGEPPDIITLYAHYLI